MQDSPNNKPDIKTERIARLVITEQCNLDCEYCCMKERDIRTTFKPTNTFPDIKDCTSIAITGGEPLLLKIDTIVSLCKQIKKQSKAPIYLYTNGIYLDSYKSHKIRPFITGINIGWHKHNEKLFKYLSEIINPIIPIRFRIENTNQVAIYRAKEEKTDYLIWTLGDCTSAEGEDRWLLAPYLERDVKVDTN
jgi:hypothetical protein